jgi:protein arginine N-methyltransferase 3
MADNPKDPKLDQNIDRNSDESSSTGSEDNDNNWDDWVEDTQAVATQSLFEERTFSTPEEAIRYDKEHHGFDLTSIVSKLG